MAINRIGIPCSLIATLVALARNDKRSATKVAPPNHKKKRAQSYGEATAQRRFGFCLTSQEEERAGVGGQRGIGGCFAIKPPVPLEEKSKA